MKLAAAYLAALVTIVVADIAWGGLLTAAVAAAAVAGTRAAGGAPR
jgi:hypothetical protein